MEDDSTVYIDKSEFDLALTKANIELIQKVDKLLKALDNKPIHEWVSLSADEYDVIYINNDSYDDFASAIEFKLKEKNGFR